MTEVPHSPRLHQGRLWLPQTGVGEFGEADVASDTFMQICFLPGFARGLSCVGDYTVIGLPRPRENRTFEGLTLNGVWLRMGQRTMCGLRGQL